MGGTRKPWIVPAAVTELKAANRALLNALLWERRARATLGRAEARVLFLKADLVRRLTPGVELAQSLSTSAVEAAMIAGEKGEREDAPPYGA